MLEKIFNNWNMGTCLNSNIESKKIKYANRTDLFGYQIDHFFRFTKEAKHKIFTIGDRAFKELNIYAGEHGKKEPHIGIQCGRPGAGGIKYVMRFKKESEAKDINLPYFIHYFITDYNLRNIRHMYNELGDDSYNEAYELMCDLGAYNYI